MNSLKKILRERSFFQGKLQLAYNERGGGSLPVNSGEKEWILRNFQSISRKTG